MGRIVSRAGPGLAAGQRWYRCSCCGLERAGLDAHVVCVCGFEFNGRHHLAMRCQANTNKTPEWPSEIVAMQA